MAADSDSMRSVLGCPLLASWIAYKFYLSQDFNSIPALDTRPLRIPSLPPPPQNGNIASLPFPPTLLSAALDTSFYFLFFFFFFSSSVPSASLPPFSRYRRFTPRFHWNHATRNPTPLPSPVFLPFLLSFSFSLFLRSIRLDGGALLYYFVPRLKAIRWCYAIRVINLFEMENVTPRYYRKRCIVFHV